MQTQIDRKKLHRRIRHRVRRKISGNAQRPRLAVFRSARHIYAQAIDDLSGRTLACCSTLESTVREKSAKGGNVEAAKQVGAVIGERLKKEGVTTVIFDRGGFGYHGRLKALAEAAREAGLKF